jgi:hypothetical protein
MVKRNRGARVTRVNRRRQNRQYKRRSKAKWLAYVKQLRKEHLSAIAPLTQHPFKPKVRARCIEAPASINLTANYLETIKFLKNVRECASAGAARFFVDFKTIKEITPAGALLLVAEFDRWREMVQQQRLEPLDLESWDPVVKTRLLEMGFFDLLRSTRSGKQPESPRDWWRLQLLRRWSHEQVEQVLT